MNWLNKIDRIVCLNLLKRSDRLLEFTKQMEEYKIPFDRVQSIEDTQSGARGLRDTMVALFSEEISKGTENLLVFEDDAVIIKDEFWFNDTMNKMFDQLPLNYHMVFLGCQLTTNVNNFYSPNLIQVIKAFSTHACLYSLQGMKEILNMGLEYPIDNDMVDRLQPMGHCYCTNPFLVSQRPGVSDIGGQFISWKPFLEDRFEQRMAEINNRQW